MAMTTHSQARLARRQQHPLGVLFAPESVAIFGATNKPGSVGRTVMSNLIRNPFGGWILPINPGQRSAHGIEAYPNLAAVPTQVELAIVATPAPTVPAILDECRAAGVKAALVLSGGFGESGPIGAELGHQIREGLQRGPMRVVGPNSIGLVCPSTGFNATFAPAMVPYGKIGFLSQSGALLTALLQQGGPASVGCSTFISVGSLLDIDWAEWLNYLALDPQTECIGIYMEQVGDARSFFAAAREVALQKPIILIKGGKRDIEGPLYDVFEEACRCSGILRVDRFADLLRVVEHLTSRPRVKGRQLAIVSNARGPALLVSDALHAGCGSLASLAPETIRELREMLPPRWNQQNPIDVGDDADASRFSRAAAIAARDPHSDALLILLTPQATIDPVQVAEEIAVVARSSVKPIFACWMWGAASDASLGLLWDAGIPTFHSPETAIRTFAHLWRHTESCGCLGAIQEALTEAVEMVSDRPEEGRLRTCLAEEVANFERVEAVRLACQAGQTALTDVEARELLSACGLPVEKKRIVSDESEALEVADTIGYPVLLELDVGSDATQFAEDHEVIRLKVADAGALRQALRTLRRVASEPFGRKSLGHVSIRQAVPPTAVELTASLATHAELGTVIRLGESSHRAKPSRHLVAALAPLTVETARQMIEQSRIHQTVQARSANKVNLEVLERFLVRLSRLGVEQPWIKEITISSLLVWQERVVARNIHAALNSSADSKSELRSQGLVVNLEH
jgi:acetyltransferase